MESVACLGCGGGGSVLVCNQNGCGFAVHEKCLPCSVYVDDLGCFYCPQCSYERALEECIKAEKRASLAKQALLKFISAPGGNNQQREVEATDSEAEHTSPLTSERDVIHLAQAGELREKEDSVRCKKTCSPGSLLKECCVNVQNSVLRSAEVDLGDTSRKTMDRLVHPATSLESENAKNLDIKNTRSELCSAPNQGNETRESAASAKHPSFSQKCGTDKLHAFELRERKRKLQIPDADSYETDEGAEQPPVLKKNDSPGRRGLMEKSHDTERGVVNDMPDTLNATKRKGHADELSEESDVVDRLYIEESDISDCDIDTTINKKPSVNRPQREKGAKYARRSSNDSGILKDMADKSVEGSHSREFAEKSPKKSSINSNNLGKQKKCRVKWTAEEVEILKEGVHKFYVPHKNLPWARILEYGSRVFDHSRSASDLKDKWRKMEKVD